MLLTYLAREAATPAALREHLLGHALAGLGREHIELRAALCANPATTAAQRRDLLEGVTVRHGRVLVVTSALLGTSQSGGDLLALLEGESSLVLVSALAGFADPDGQMARLVFERATGPAAWSELLVNSTTPHDVRLAAASALCRHGRSKPTSFVRKALCETIRTHLRAAAGDADAQQAAAALLAELRPTTVPKLADELAAIDVAALLRGPARGTTDWFADPRTPAADLIDYVTVDRGGSANAWVKVLRAAPDADGTLATAAWHACGSAITVARQVVESHAPMPIRQKAATQLSNRTAHTNSSDATARQMLDTADLTWAVRYATRRAGEPELTLRVTRRPDVTAEVLGALLDAYEQTGAVRWSHNSTLMFGVTLATHPVATPAQRAAGRALARTPAPTTGAAAHRHRYALDISDQCRQIVDAAEHLDPTTPGTAAATGRALPLSTVDKWALAHLPTLHWILAEALASLLPSTYSADAARVLASICDGFAGTLEDLVLTADAIA